MIFSSPERQAPTKVLEAEPSHLARYSFALQFIKSTDEVLDAPCGSGYGSNLIGAKAKHITGIDIDSATIQHAKEFFNSENIEFVVGNIENISTSFPKASKFDVVVSFEGIEHLKDREKFLLEVRKKLKPGGHFIVSTPRKPHGSQYHTVEFSLEEFRDILSKNFVIEKMFGQIYTDIFDIESRKENPHSYKRFNFIALCKPK